MRPGTPRELDPAEGKPVGLLAALGGLALGGWANSVALATDGFRQEASDPTSGSTAHIRYPA